MQFRRLLPLMGVIIVVAGIAACDNDPERSSELGPIQPPDPIPVTRYVSGVDMDGATTTYTVDPMPTGDAAAPALTGSAWFVRGGSMVVNVTVEDTATQLYVSTTNADFGYFAVPLDAAPAVVEEQRVAASVRAAKLASVSEAPPVGADLTAFRAPRTVTLVLTPAEAASAFTVSVRSFDGTNVSQRATNQVRVNTTANSSAELQVSLNWIDPVDYDIHVVAPDDERIFFANKTGANGGELDLDSNAACSIDGINNENITWGSTSPMAGEYVVELDLWSECTQPGPFQYLVTVVIDGEAQVFEGSMVPEDTEYLEITRFTISD